MKKIKKSLIILILSTFSLSITLQSCEEIIDIIAEILNLGWLEDKEDMDNIPEDITPFDEDTSNLQKLVSLDHLFPPIGDQGQYGTCVVWAVGYNLKTALNAIEQGWTQTHLSNTANQTSPKDLWMAIPSSKKGTKCNGTNFEPALDALIANGGASLSDVPYTNLGNCTETNYKGNTDNKLANYRKIASEAQGLDVNNFKGYLNAGRPIAIGAKLGDRFMKWNSESILTYDTYNNPGMQHAYHAMVLTGYDEIKKAFRVRNSWGSSWGDKGNIWVGYEFFCKSFCFAAFVAQNTNVSFGGTITLDGYDLLALEADDWEYNVPASDPDYNPDFTRSFEYEVYNSGTENIKPSQRWTTAYMYYNAFDANDYQFIIVDYYTDEMDGSVEGDWDYWEDAEKYSLLGGFWNNITLNREKSIAWEFNYIMPKITGKYYLVLFVDCYDAIREANEDNNFYFITAAGGKPIEYINGVPQNLGSKSLHLKNKTEKPELFGNTENQTLVKPGNLNTYTPQELKTMLLHDKKTGKLETKIKAFKENGGNNKVTKQIRR